MGREKVCVLGETGAREKKSGERVLGEERESVCVWGGIRVREWGESVR